jgi:VCBS repeat-containing protein
VLPGTLTYTSAAGSVLHAGNGQSESVTFIPTDTADYTSASSTVTVNVAKAKPTVTLNPVNITPGTALANVQLRIRASIIVVIWKSFAGKNDLRRLRLRDAETLIHAPVLSGTATFTTGKSTVTVPGEFTYTSADGSMLKAGKEQSEAVTFTPNDTTDYATASVTVTVNVTQPAPVTPGVTVNPVNITYGTALASLGTILSSKNVTATSGIKVTFAGDSDASAVTATASIKTATSGAGTVGGGVLLDINGDGVEVPNDIPLAGWTVFIDMNKNGKLDPGEPHAVTDSDGNYVLSVAKPGTYDLREVPPPLWRATSPAGGAYKNVVVTSGHLDDGMDFLNVPPPSTFIEHGWRVSVPYGVYVARKPGAALNLDVSDYFTGLAARQITFTQIAPYASPTITIDQADLSNRTGQSLDGAALELVTAAGPGDVAFEGTSFKLGNSASVFSSQRIGTSEITFAGRLGAGQSALLGSDGGDVIINAKPAKAGPMRVFSLSAIP